MTLTLYETIQRIVQEEMRRLPIAELAIVQEQHPHAGESDKDNYACTVQLRNSGVVLAKVPVATPRIGAVSIPAVGDLVLVQFVGGDINAPVITGSFYNDEDRPPVNDDGQTVLHLPLAAGDDDAVHLELHSGDKREIVIKLGKGLALTLRDDDPAIEIDVDNGKATLQIERSGALTIKSGGDVTLEGNAITIKASGELTLKGSMVNIN
jgi:uncharacterized protein involved in type VI secretion and phage assembly